jgi:hypothetical protein
MTLRKLWLMLRRWRWIVIPGLVLAEVAGVWAGYVSPVSYRVQSSYLFLSPVTGADGSAGNPFLQLGNGVSTTVDILAVSLSDVITTESYTQDAPDLTYTAVRDTSLSAPILVITVEDVSVDNAYETLDALGADLSERLDALQERAGAPQGQWVTATQLTRDPKAEVGLAIPIRNGVAAGLGVILLTLLVMAIAERRANSRQQRAGRTVVDGGPGGPGGPGEPGDLSEAARPAEPAPTRRPVTDGSNDPAENYVLVPEPPETQRSR